MHSTESLSARDGKSKSDIDYLRYDYLMVMIVLISAVAAFGVVRASYCWPRSLWACAWPTPLALAGTALAAYGLRNISQRLASWILIGGILAANTAEIWRFPDGPAPYLLSLIVIVAATLRSARNAWGIVALASAMLVVMAVFLNLDLTVSEIAGPLVMLGLTGLVAWSSTGQFYAAVDWALYSVREAQARATEAELHRAELLRLNKALDDAYQRLERMNQMLILARRSAEEARLHKTQFANAVSHELRSPINMIIGFSEMMVNAPEVYGPQAWPPRLRQHITQVYQSARHLSQLIDDVLDMARIDTHRMVLNKQVTHLGEVIEEAADLVRGLFEARHLYLRTEIDARLPPVAIDRTRIRQVLLNLLTNAVRFTREGGVTLRAYTHEEAVLCQVTDTGPGISAENLPLLFQEFRQLDGSFYQWGRGSGLGLAISKRLIELHSGRIWAESTLGHGSTFAVAIPLQATDWQPAQPAAAPDTAFWEGLEREARQGQRILAYADERARRLLSAALAGYDVAWVDHEAELSQAAADLYPAAIVCAGEMAQRGSDTLPELARQVPTVPVIACSAPGTLAEPVHTPFGHYLVKPVLRETLEDVLYSLDIEFNTVLLVDDDPMMLEYLRTAIRSFSPGCRLVSAESAAAALRQAQEVLPDVVVLDLGLPDMNGRELALKLDELLAGRARLIAVTAQDSVAEDARDTLDEVYCVRNGRFSQKELEAALRAIIGSFTVEDRASPQRAPAIAGGALASA